MIKVSDSAQQYFNRLIGQQDEEGLGLRISVSHPGTPGASCDLQFSPEGQRKEDDIVVNLEGFNMFVAAASEKWLADAEIDFEEDPTGGQLTIRAPGIKGSEPSADADMTQRINWLLETEINPALASHGGQVSLVEITDKLEVILQFGGGCQGCGMADVTLKQGIEQTLTRNIPEITAVRDVTDHQSGTNPYYAGDATGESVI
ncbi:NfuA family Fe-S biogenesis protein [Pseudomonadota bacterium]